MCVQVHHAVGRLDWAGHANQAIFLAEHMREPPGPPFGAPSLQGLNKMTLWAVLGWEQDSDSRRTNLIPEISWSEPICSGRHRFDGHICMQRGLVFCPVVQVGVHQVVHQLLTNTFDAGACPRHAPSSSSQALSSQCIPGARDENENCARQAVRSGRHR